MDAQEAQDRLTQIVWQLSEITNALHVVGVHVGLLQRWVEMQHAPLPFKDISGGLMRHATKRYNTRALDTITQIVIHHVGVDAEVGPWNTAQYHVKTKGWPGIAYHFYIRTDGTAYMTQPLDVVSYHCAGTCNTVSIGVCLEGSFMEHEPPPAQLEATRAVLQWIWWKAPIPGDDDIPIRGHREIRSTACPGNTWSQWKDKVMP